MLIKYEMIMTTRFKKDYKNMLKRGCKREKLLKVVDLLLNGQKLSEKYKDHTLIGN